MHIINLFKSIEMLIYALYALKLILTILITFIYVSVYDVFLALLL